MSVKSETTVRYREDLREQIRLELESTRVTFHELLNEISTEGLTKPSLNPAWNISEMLFHMSLAVRNLPSDVRLIRNLKWFSKLPAKPFNRLNIYLARRGAHNATKETFAKAYDQAHARTIQALKKVKDEKWGFGMEYPDWDPSLAWYGTRNRQFRNIKLHFESHAGDIRQAMDIVSK